MIDFLFNHGRSVTQTDIDRAVGVEQPTMAATLYRMERDGQIIRVPDPSDARRSFVSPTAAVKRKRARLLDARHRAEAEMLAALDEN